jgi:hypothetical protein
VYEEGQKLCWKEAKVLQIEPNTTYRKYRESAHVSVVENPISQPSLDISPIWTPVIAAEVRKLEHHPVYIKYENCALMLVPYRKFLFHVDFYSDTTLILTTITVKYTYCLDIGARPHVF